MHELNVNFPKLNEAGEYVNELDSFKDLEAEIDNLSAEIDKLNKELADEKVAYEEKEKADWLSDMRKKASEAVDIKDDLERDLYKLKKQYAHQGGVYYTGHWGDDKEFDSTWYVDDKEKQAELAEQEKELQAKIDAAAAIAHPLWQEWREYESKRYAEYAAKRDAKQDKVKELTNAITDKRANALASRKELSAELNNASKVFLKLLEDPELANNSKLKSIAYKNIDSEGNPVFKLTYDFESEWGDESRYYDEDIDGNPGADLTTFEEDMWTEIDHMNEAMQIADIDDLNELNCNYRYNYKLGPIDLEFKGHLEYYEASSDDPGGYEEVGDMVTAGTYDIIVTLNPIE